MVEDLEGIAGRIEDLRSSFVFNEDIFSDVLPSENVAEYKALSIEAKSIIDEELGPVNDYSLRLMREGVATRPPSPEAVEEVSQLIRAAIRSINRGRVRPPAPSEGSKPYVDPARVSALQSMGGGLWDFARLVELCREINVTAANRCHMATAMLLRTILNHVPPVLGFATFAEVANSYGGPKTARSFKAAMQRLENVLRVIADMHLHSPIRPTEDVPSAVQVDFAAELDVLLGEVIRVGRTAHQGGKARSGG